MKGLLPRRAPDLAAGRALVAAGVLGAGRDGSALPAGLSMIPRSSGALTGATDATDASGAAGAVIAVGDGSRGAGVSGSASAAVLGADVDESFMPHAPARPPTTSAIATAP